MARPEFLCDIMLSKLSRWLRMLGYSSPLPKSQDDDELIKQAMAGKLILLTRDADLFQKSKSYCHSYWVKSSTLDGQLLEMFSLLNINPEKIDISKIPSETICAVCNGKLANVKKAKLNGKVPKKSYENAERFYECKNCKKMYWTGSHNLKIQAKIRQIVKLHSLK